MVRFEGVLADIVRLETREQVVSFGNEAHTQGAAPDSSKLRDARRNMDNLAQVSACVKVGRHGRVNAVVGVSTNSHCSPFQSYTGAVQPDLQATEGSRGPEGRRAAVGQQCIAEHVLRAGQLHLAPNLQLAYPPGPSTSRPHLLGGYGYVRLCFGEQR